MIYEFRAYRAVPGKKQALLDRFEQVNMRFFERHGIRVVGFWETEIGPSNQVVYLCAFEDLTARQSAWDAFHADEEWLEIRRRWAEEGPVTDHIVNEIWKPVSFSPQP